MAGPHVDEQSPLCQNDGAGEAALAVETADLCAAALAAGADQCDSFLKEATRDYRRLWAALQASATPDGVFAAWQDFWTARTASYLGAAFRAAASSIVDVELAANGVATHRLPI